MDKITKKSKKLSWLLRHGAREVGLTMDPAGWVSVTEVLYEVRMRRADLETVVQNNNKNRLELVGERIRCCQGHSLDVGVTQDALEASWQSIIRTEVLVHGTQPRAVEGIAAGGIKPMERTHVHLADSGSSRVGKRANVSVLLQVDPMRLDGLWRSPNGVYLTRFVPVEAIVGVKLTSNAAQRQGPRMREQLGL